MTNTLDQNLFHNRAKKITYNPYTTTLFIYLCFGVKSSALEIILLRSKDRKYGIAVENNVGSYK